MAECVRSLQELRAGLREIGGVVELQNGDVKACVNRWRIPGPAPSANDEMGMQ